MAPGRRHVVLARRRGSYEYIPLHQDIDPTIRLMHLLPGQFNDPLSCYVTEVPLASFSCEALSYVWGEPGGNKTIGMRNVSKLLQKARSERSLPIPENLDVALRYLRRKHQIRELWVDAVCINQQDIEEKQAQIPLMARIYSQASHCIIWLGEPSDTGCVRRLFHNLRMIDAVALRSHSRTVKRLFWPIEMSTAIFLNLNDHMGRTCKDIFERAWFRRVWTLQELLLNRSPLVVCGPCSAPWMAFRHLAFYGDLINLGSHSELLPGFSRYYLSHSGFHGAGSSVLHDLYQQILIEIILSEATNLQDKVMGSLAILEMLSIRMPAVDYSMSLDQLYAAVTFAFAKSLNSLNWLNIASSREQLSDDMPSWVIDLSNEGRYLHQGSFVDNCLDSRWPSKWQVNDLSACNSCHNSAPQGRFDRHDLRLALKGVILDDSVRVYDIPEYSKPPSSDLVTLPLPAYKANRFFSWIHLLLDIADGNLAAVSVMIEHLAYSVVKKDPTNTLQLQLDVIVTYLSAMLRYCLNARQDIYLEEGTFIESLDSDCKRFHEVLSKHPGWPFSETVLVTDECRVGLGYCHRVQRGDVIAILEGADLPIVLHPVRNEGCYQLVGPVVMYGMMEGEMWPDDAQGLQTITLV